MTPALAVATAVAFVWLGMVLGISFLEAPLKFRAPEVTLRIGLGIGRVVFRALNIVESVLAATVLVCMAVASSAMPRGAQVSLGVAVVVLVAQLAAVRPSLTRRSTAVLQGTVTEDGPSSHAHLWYVGLEVVKVVALVAGGALLLRG